MAEHNNPIARYAASHQMLNQEFMASGEILSSEGNNTGEIQLPFQPKQINFVVGDSHREL